MLDTIIMDEAQAVCNHTSKRHKAARALPAKHKFMFTGSPLMNSPMDLYSLYRILQPQLFPNFMFFILEYMNRHPTYGYVVGAKQNKLAQLGKIISPYFIRRTLAEVAPQLPPHIDEIVKFDLSEKETKLYGDIRAELLLSIDPKSIDLVKNPMSLQNALVKLQKLSELTDSPDLIGHSEIPSTKISILEEKLKELLTGNERKCVVFSRFARMINILEPILAEYNPVVIQGNVSGEDRQLAITKFKTDSTCRLMLITTAGSEGISLEEAQYLIRLDTAFSIGRDIQLTGRIRRITSEEPTFSFTLCANKTVDEKMLKILEKKKLINSSIFGWEDIKELLQ